MSKTSDEALARLEHKLDITLDLVMEIVGRIYGIKHNGIPKMGDISHTCPVCKVGVKYVVDMVDKSVTRQCECKTGKYAPIDLEAFAPPMVAGGTDGQGSSKRDAASEGESESGERGGAQGSRRR